MNQTSPTDPNVTIPAAVRAAAARSAEAFEAAYNNETTQTPDAETAEGTTPPQAEEGRSELAASEFTADAVTREVSEPQRDEPSADDQSWEHRYKSMKGRYDRASQQIQALSDQIASLQNVIATMQVSSPQGASDWSSDTEPSKFITPEEESDYGQDFLAVVGKKAKEELLPVIKKYESKISELEARLQGVNGYVAQDARSRLEQTMDTQVPSWREINFNPEFIQWLKLPDPYSGAIRHELLKEAYGRNDAARVANFFKGFLAEEAAVAPVNREPDLSQSAQAQAQNKIPLEEFAAPGRAKTAAATSAPAEKPTFTRAQIAKFYQDSAAGKYRGKEADRDRTERQIFEAEREGRIR
jgi:hypothetical protein